MNQSLSKPNLTGQLLLYQTEDAVQSEGKRALKRKEKIQKFDENRVVKDYLITEELSEVATCKECLQVQSEGERQVSPSR